jgi:hypothetical protein
MPPAGYNLKRFGPLAQLAEQLTLNQRVLGSSPKWVTQKAGEKGPEQRAPGLFFAQVYPKNLSINLGPGDNAGRRNEPDE